MEAPALRAAVELTLMPSRTRSLRDGPLPEGVTLLLRIAAGDEAAENEAMAISERPRKMVRESAAFFIEQMLLHPEADSYRVLGAKPNAPAAELRQNMALLMRWLHPDSNREETRGVFVNRVNRAWDDLKSVERRQAYDRNLANKPAPRPKTSGKGLSGGSRNRRHSIAATTYKRRGLQASDLLEPFKSGQWGMLRRALAFFLRPKG